jgi:hypothetical protein
MLSITPGDGFILPAERAPKWVKRATLVTLKEQHLHAAASLDLLEPIDISMFDSLCRSLLESREPQSCNMRAEADACDPTVTTPAPHANAKHEGATEQAGAFELLCRLVMDVCQHLLDPHEHDDDFHAQPPAHTRAAAATHQGGTDVEAALSRPVLSCTERWDYFQSTVCKLGIWMMEPALPDQLALLTQRFIHTLQSQYMCRCGKMQHQEGGAYLMSEEIERCARALLFGKRPRQDDDEVRAIRASPEDRLEMLMAAQTHLQHHSNLSKQVQPPQ